MRSVHYRILRSYKDTPHGPSDRIRTCGILLPKQARYQLRYTRLFSFCYYTTPRAKIKVFPVCGHLCGQSGYTAQLVGPVKSRKCPCCKGFRGSAAPIVDRDAYAPKAGVLQNRRPRGYPIIITHRHR